VAKLVRHREALARLWLARVDEDAALRRQEHPAHAVELPPLDREPEQVFCDRLDRDRQLVAAEGRVVQRPELVRTLIVVSAAQPLSP
jgi:hypothetical protein